MLDTKEYFKQTPEDIHEVFSEDFESDSLACQFTLADSSSAACLNESNQFYGPVVIPLEKHCDQWLRFEGDFTIQTREWDVWKFTQWIVQFKNGDQVVKTNFIKLQRLLPLDQVPASVFFDVRIPKADFDSCSMTFWNAGSSNTILIDNLRISCFME